MAFKQIDPKPDFPKLEEEMLKFWEDNKIFEKSLEQTKQGKPFVFFEGPPTANAKPGIHHVEARAFKDLIPRFQTMRGRFVLRKAGWDTHGLPVELQVEKQLGISGKKQIESIKPTVRESIIEFNRLCKESVWQYKQDWEKLTQRMGFWIDMEHPYITYENSYIESVWAILKKIWDKDLIYLGHKVVPYCPRCGTPLSSHEVALGYKKVTDNSVYVKFKVKDNGLPITDHGSTYILSWTTTPWTLPGNVALAVGKSIDYVKAKVGEEFWILAKDRLDQVRTHTPKFDDRTKEEYKGSDLIGLEYESLFNVPSLKSDKSYQVYDADFVTTTDGTGVVHTAVMYGEEDYELGSKVGLPKFHTVDETGKFIDAVPDVGGLSVKEKATEDKIIAHLKANNNLVKTESYEHDYPFCWRCDTALLYYARDSWFIKMSALREQLLANNEQINWVPDYIKHGRFGEWLSEIKDWAISRERYWGTPLPIWQCQQCSDTQLITSLGLELADLHRPYIDEVVLKCQKCGGQSKRVPAVLDVWFDSGSMPYAQWHWPFENEETFKQQFPADYISEAVDQTRGWFYTLLAISTLLDKGSAYKNVINLGLLLDEKGQKMSKSKGNVVDPWTIINKQGIDALRWYMYSVNQPGDSKLFAVRDIDLILRKHFMILWNVLSYLVTYSSYEKWEVVQKLEVRSQKLDIMDRWIRILLQKLVNDVTDSLETFDVFRGARAIETFINDLSTWYLRRSRERRGNDVYQTLYEVLKTLSQVLAPFTPFLAEQIWQILKQDQDPESVHLSAWPAQKGLSAEEKNLILAMEVAREAVSVGLAARKQLKLPVRQPLSRLAAESNLKDVKFDQELLDVILAELNVKKVDQKLVNEAKTNNKIFGFPGSQHIKYFYLDSTVSQELKLEGLARHLERAVQDLRKEKGLRVGETVELRYNTDSDELKAALKLFNKDKTYIKKLVEASVLEGETVEIGGKKIILEL